MSDDGMLLNFAVDNEAVIRNLPKYKGGSWRERLKAEKSAKRRKRPREQFQEEEKPQGAEPTEPKRINASKTHDDFPEPRPTKRRRGSGEFTPRTTERPKPTKQDQGRGPVHDSQPRKPRDVISSLFTFNPEPSQSGNPTSPLASESPAKPSNAPLPDGIDTFTSLGLSTTVSVHLMTKMGLETPTAVQKAAIPQMLHEVSDAFLQSETGSGKTLAYLLPIVQKLMELSGKPKPDPQENQTWKIQRDSGLFAIILAPTRELCKQIAVALERVLGCAHYIVAGNVIGGEKKKSEKARLRKGVNILVATPGRLVDHLENTKVLNISTVRWLVLDEGDRLMELGFEHDITKIITALDQRKSPSFTVHLPETRTTVLCSATMKTNIQKLGEVSLKDAVLIKPNAELDADTKSGDSELTQSAFLAPAQLKQSFMVVPAKLRLVALTALLRRSFSRKGSVMKAIVFVSCADSVEFHFRAFTRKPGDTEEEAQPFSPEVEITDGPKQTSFELNDNFAPCPMLNAFRSSDEPLILYKLHGSLPQQTRTACIKAFACATTPSLLIATDVASRGLDLPNLDLVIEYDPAFSAEDHLHRIGRTARLGRDGRAVIFLLPGSEEGYVDVLRRSYRAATEGTAAVAQTATDDILKKGFSPVSGLQSNPESKNWEQRATDFQLGVERWVLASAENKELARHAFQSHVRAYATHIAAERKWFDMGQLHLGHLAKAFGLRDAPGNVNIRKKGKKADGYSRRTANGNTKASVLAERSDLNAARDQEHDAGEAAEKMRRKVRNRKSMMGGGVDEFNIA